MPNMTMSMPNIPDGLRHDSSVKQETQADAEPHLPHQGSSMLVLDGRNWLNYFSLTLSVRGTCRIDGENAPAYVLQRAGGSSPQGSLQLRAASVMYKHFFPLSLAP